MSNLKAGFARIDITPPLGTGLGGYPRKRPAEGILDNLMATAVAFDNGEKRAVVISLDLVGIEMILIGKVRSLIADAIGTPAEAVFVHCTHTHTGPSMTTDGENANPEYIEWFMKKAQDVAVLAFQDLAPAELFCTRDEAKEVAFVRTYLMKDGSYKTNPGRLNPDIVGPVSEPDNTVQLLLIKRENAPEIGIVNFQVHPDVIGGNKISADYPKFVRDTYEKLIDNSRCMYINGPQGDTNDANVRLERGKTIEERYDYARYMGRKIAMAALANYELVQPIEGDEINFAQKSVLVKYNKGTPDQYEGAQRAVDLWQGLQKQGMNIWQAFREVDGQLTDKDKVRTVREAQRILLLKNFPDEEELPVSAVRVGNVVFAGFPGEPFTDIGRAVKENSKFALTITACIANGYQGYFPTEAAYNRVGAYENSITPFRVGVAEKLLEGSMVLVNSL